MKKYVKILRISKSGRQRLYRQDERFSKYPDPDTTPFARLVNRKNTWYSPLRELEFANFGDYEGVPSLHDIARKMGLEAGEAFEYELVD